MELIRALRTPEGRANPYPHYARLRDIGPVWAADEDWVVATGYEACERVLRGEDFGVDDIAEFDRSIEDWRSSPVMRRAAASLHFMNGSDHARVRRLVAAAFTARRITGMRERVVDATDRLLDDLAERGTDQTPTDFVSAFAFELPITVICDLVGVSPADRHWFHQRVNAIVAGPPLRAGRALLEADRQPRSLAGVDQTTLELREFFDELVRARRTAPTDDLASALVAAHDEAATISHDELLAGLALVVAAGFITTMNLLSNGLSILLDQPNQLRRLREDPGLTPDYVEEMLRYECPVQVLARRALRDTSLHGIPLPARSSVAVLVGAANRDPARYARPDTFDPDRSPNHVLSFGSGPHFCLGSQLARLEATIAFRMLLDRFPHIERAGEPTRHDLLVLRGFTHLPIVVREGGGTR